jgi:hypothetical protein
VLGAGVCEGDRVAAAVDGAIIDGFGAAAIDGAKTGRLACSVGKCGAYTTACSEANLMSHSTKMEPFSGQ